MIVEVLFSEFYTYGEIENVRYLAKMLKGVDFIYTSYDNEPYFVNNDVDMLVIEPMAEHYLAMVCDKLKPFKTRLQTMIDDGVYFFIVNNAMDIFGRTLKLSDGKELDTLGLLDYETIRNYDKRYAYLFVAKYQDIEICANNTGFSTYCIPDKYHLYSVELNGIKASDIELSGYHKHNVYAIEFLSHFFIMNPLISKKILAHFGIDESLPFEQEALESYNHQLKLFKNDAKLLKHYQSK
ncbi:MAG: hypothetical protein SPI53_03420 [Erysipelotrichaceae bacterium]|nr:hypothetical protein [Erysipelotrichaceae bacterium]